MDFLIIKFHFMDDVLVCWYFDQKDITEANWGCGEISDH
jgi:hypothetical protein